MVQMAMVVDGDDFVFNDVFELLEVDDEAGYGIDLAGDCYLQRVVVAVALAVGALAEDARILFLGPRIVPIEVGGGKIGFAGKENHRTRD
jgi:hypothetical protein